MVAFLPPGRQITIGGDGAGNVFVAENRRPRAQKFDSSGSFVAKWGSRGFGAGQFFVRCSVAVDVAGVVDVVDEANPGIQTFKKNARNAMQYDFVTQFGSPGSGTGRFGNPNAIAHASDGNIFVAHRPHHRIPKVAPAGVAAQVAAESRASPGHRGRHRRASPKRRGRG